VLAALIIVFREVIEVGLVVGIVLAATRGLAHRGRWVGYGLVGGVAGSCVVAAFAGSIGEALAGAGQELFNAAVLAIAVVMLAWHNIWMARQGRHIAAEVRAVGEAVMAGRRSMAALAVVVGVATLREGSEIVLFLYGIAVSGGDTAAAMMAGGMLGLVAGAGLSAVMYFGLLRIPAGRLFGVTSWLIALLAAGMASQAVGFLQQAGKVTALSQVLWDTSNLLPDDSVTGRALHTLLGYTDRPTGIQLAVYASTLAGIFLLMRVLGHPAAARPEGTVQ